MGSRKKGKFWFCCFAAAMISCEGVIIENDEGDAAEEQKAPVWVLEDACRHGYPPTPLPACPSARELF